MPAERHIWTAAPPGGDPFPFDVALHPCPGGRIALLLPGYDGDIDGYAGKYRRIAELLQERGVAAVVRAGNHPLDELDYEVSSPAQLRAMVAGARAAAPALCGGDGEPELLFLGVSAGASTMASLASEVGRLSTALLVAPSADAGEEAVRRGLAAYRGALLVVVGEHDLVVGRAWPEALLAAAPRAARRELVVVPRCDHQFTGARNGRILSQAPLWAFAGDGPFPDPDRGVHLYD